MAVCSIRRADETLPQAHGREAVPLPPLRALLLALRPPGAPREASRVARDSTAPSQEEEPEQAHAKTVNGSQCALNTVASESRARVSSSICVVPFIDSVRGGLRLDIVIASAFVPLGVMFAARRAFVGVGVFEALQAKEMSLRTSTRPSQHSLHLICFKLIFI